jgi:hypothetical protein
MATSRRRTSGFTEKPKEEVKEEAQVEELLDEIAAEMFETISRKEEEALEEPLPVAPIEEVSPHVEEKPVAPKPQSRAVTPKPLPVPKRHPRNIPKVSRYK